MDYLLGLSAVLVIGVSAQWLAWRLHIPAILLLLSSGFLAGPILGLVDPDFLLGDLFVTIVSLSVGIILFEGGLDLRISELGSSAKVVRNLVTVGALVTWVVGSLSIMLILGLPLPLSVLIGSILVVTGPTVIIPMLRHLRLSGKAGGVGTILKWEGIVIDPIGAVLATLVFEALVAIGPGEAAFASVLVVLKTILIGIALGVFASLFLIILLRRYWIPDYLQNPVTLAVVVAAYTLSDIVQAESGFLTVTLMGIILTNQQTVRIKHIVEFKETLRVLLISILFVLLSARMELSALSVLGWESLILLAVTIAVVRPLSVWCSTVGSDLKTKERLFLSALAPRGIVAASVAWVFADKLGKLGYPQAELIIPVTFLVIIGTVAFYSLATPFIARALDLSQPNPQGVLFIGAHRWGRKIALALQKSGCKVLLIDTNRYNINAARREGLPTQLSNIFSDHLVEELILAGIGRLVAITPNDEVNTLAALHFSADFGSAEVYQLAPASTQGEVLKSLGSRILFSRELGFSELDQRFEKGAVVETLAVEKELDLGSFVADTPDDPVPLFFVKSSGEVVVMTAVENSFQLGSGTLVYLKG